MRHLPSRLRRLDDALASLPLDEPMLLSELDGFLTGVAVSPAPILPDEWLPIVWGADGDDGPPFDDPADVRWFADAVTTRYDAIVRDLDRGKPQPIFDVDERNGDVLWDLWIDGFAEATALRPESWTAVADGDDGDAAAALSYLSTLIAVARDESALDSLQVNALDEDAPAGIAASVLRLHASRRRHGDAPSPSSVARPAKVGRNEPCPCGSGQKFKRCCG